MLVMSVKLWYFVYEIYDDDVMLSRDVSLHIEEHSLYRFKGIFVALYLLF
jgi:hypothetical protein